MTDPNLIKWDETAKRFYETGVDHCVLYLLDENGAYSKGYAWNGITAVTEKPSGAEANAKYADNMKYINMMSAEEFAATIEAYTYPDEFAACDGSKEGVVGVKIGQQNRATFGLAYRTLLGNDVDGNSLGYKLHLIYGAKVSPSEKAYATINDSPEAISFSWELTTTAVPVADVGEVSFNPTAYVVIDSTKVAEEELAEFLVILYGVAADPGATPPVTKVEARLPLPDEVITLLTHAGG